MRTHQRKVSAISTTNYALGMEESDMKKHRHQVKYPTGTLRCANLFAHFHFAIVRISIFALCLLLVASITLQAPISHAAATSKQVKLLKGRWYKGSSGFADYYYTFTKKYCKQHHYKSGKVISKDKIISVKKSGKEYIFYMKRKGYKYWYSGTVKNGKIKNLNYCWQEDGERHYSGGSSLFRENFWH